MKKAVYKIACVIAVILLAWVAVSYIDVLANNLHENPEYLPFNLFAILFQ